jgi:hypothetical protein
LIGHPAQRLRMGRNAHALANERFHAGRNNQRVLHLVSQVASALN